jgi:hypothetical protein
MSCEPVRGLRIACLGWGSLVWDPRELPIRREWFKDGPFAPVEFTRLSSDGRMTLVIDPKATPLRILWAHMFPIDLNDAREALRKREDVRAKDWSRLIGSWQFGEPDPVNIPGLPTWAAAHGLDAAVWTALEPKFRERGASPSREEVIQYLSGLRGPVRDQGKQYIERAPRQIDTNYRRQIEATMGWSCRDLGR